MAYDLGSQGPFRNLADDAQRQIRDEIEDQDRDPVLREILKIGARQVLLGEPEHPGVNPLDRPTHHRESQGPKDEKAHIQHRAPPENRADRLQ